MSVKKKAPAVLVEESKLGTNGEVSVKLTCPVLVCKYIGDKLVVGGGAPEKYGLGSPLGWLDIDVKKPTETKNKYRNDECYIEGMTDVVPFKGSGEIAVCAYEEHIHFTLFDRDAQEHRPIARYGKHCDRTKKQHEERLVGISPSGRVAVVTTDAFSLHVVALEQNDAASAPDSLFRARPAAVLEGHTKSIISVAISPLPPPEGIVFDQNKPRPLLVASVSEDGTMRLWRTGDMPEAEPQGWVEQINSVTSPAGIITLSQPPHLPHNNNIQKKFRLQVVRFSNGGTELHAIMTRGLGPSFLVSYAISWKKTENRRYALSCTTLASVEIDRADAVTHMEVTPCGRYLVFGNADQCALCVMSKQGDIIARIPEYHYSPITAFSVRTLGPDRLLIASASMMDQEVKVRELKITEGMTPGEVLRVASSLVALLGVVFLAIFFFAEPDTLHCLWTKVYTPAAAEEAAAVQSAAELALASDYGENRYTPAVLRRVYSERTLRFLNLKDPAIMSLVGGPPILALLLAVGASASAAEVVLFAWTAFAGGAFLGDGVLNFLPLAHTANSYHYFLFALTALFFLDSVLKPPPADPAFAQTNHAVNINPSNVVTYVGAGSAAEKAGIKVGTKVCMIAGSPVKEGEAFAQLQAIKSTRFEVQTVKGEFGSNVAVPLDGAWRSSLLCGFLQHLSLILMFEAKTSQHAFLYSAHCIFYEIAGAAVLLACYFDPLEAILTRVALMLVWVIVPLGLFTPDSAAAAAAWVFPLTAAASIYVAVVHLFHALAATEAFGTGGVVVQTFMMVLGLCVHSLLGY